MRKIFLIAGFLVGAASYIEQWIQEGDVVELEIDGLGKLSNSTVAEESAWSLLRRKKL